MNALVVACAVSSLTYAAFFKKLPRLGYDAVAII